MPSGQRLSSEVVDARFRAAGLEPISPYVARNKEREAICQRCGTWRRVTLQSLMASDCFPCRWCHGFEDWTAGGDTMRRRIIERGEVVRGPNFYAAAIAASGTLLALTDIGDEFTPVGCLCLDCGETLVVIPERVSGCQRCRAAGKRAAGKAAPGVFAAAGLRLLEPVRGMQAKVAAECLGCSQTRRVRYNDVVNGTGPACWSCTHGIRMDEPHRVYLFRFPALGVLKIGITHNRHDRRLFDHQANGGVLLETVVVPDRATALAIEDWVLTSRTAYLCPDVGPDDFPQGGWTEAWSEQLAPPLDLAALVLTFSR